VTPQAGPERPPTRPASNPNPTPRVSMAEIVDAVDLVALVTRYAGPPRQSGGRFTFSCPNPDHPDRSPSFTVTRDKHGRWRWKCWSQCGTGGDAGDLLVWLEGVSTSEARARLGMMTGKLRDSTPDTGRGFGRPYGYAEQERRPITNRNVLDPAEARAILTKYLQWRAWPEWTVERFRLEVVKDGGRKYRVRHPFLRPEQDGTFSVPYWQDRARTSDEGPKWISPSNGRPVPHNLPSLVSSDVRAVLLTEGPADAISATVALDGNEKVAVLGIPGVGLWRAEWVRALDGLPVAIWRDSDPAGAGLVERVRDTLGRDLGVISTDHPDLTDALRMLGPDEVRERILSEFDLDSEPVPVEEDRLSVALEIFPGSKVFVLPGGDS